MALEMDSFISATPFGIMQLIERYEIETSGKNVLVVGRSNIVGRPMSILLSQKKPFANATVTLAHSRTKNLKELSLQSDIIVVALGIPNFLKADMVSEGTVVIDVGITRVDDPSSAKGYKLVGDVDYDQVAPKSSHITPVPGGVGPMTIAMLLQNTLLAYQRYQLS
jgi:methylenetetrahydrofolate dehydrogenase (NADP+)/methenyltetrahydrofolate cyclohydrolase